MEGFGSGFGTGIFAESQAPGSVEGNSSLKGAGVHERNAKAIAPGLYCRQCWEKWYQVA